MMFSWSVHAHNYETNISGKLVSDLTYKCSLCACKQHVVRHSRCFSSDIKIVEFRNGLEGRASQMSAVQTLMNSKDLVQPEGMTFAFVLFIAAL